jgi:hypothetical protein
MSTAPLPPGYGRRLGDKLYDNDCDECFKRPGDLVCQDVMPAHQGIGIKKPWVFRYYLCRYCRSAYNRRVRSSGGERRVVPLAYKDDAELLKEGT